jgi:hypothetical protein
MKVSSERTHGTTCTPSYEDSYMNKTKKKKQARSSLAENNTPMFANRCRRSTTACLSDRPIDSIINGHSIGHSKVNESTPFVRSSLNGIRACQVNMFDRCHCKTIVSGVFRRKSMTMCHVICSSRVPIDIDRIDQCRNNATIRYDR